MKRPLRTLDAPAPAGAWYWLAWAAWLGCSLAYALSQSIDLPTFHLDGAFQTASGLYRLDARHMPGRDFFPYLGIGPLLALFPAFKAAGADLAASGISAQFMTLAAAMLATAVIWQLVWRPARFVEAMAWAALLVCGPLCISVLLDRALPPWFDFGLKPGNSLRPLRASAAYLAFGAYYLFTRRARGTYSTLVVGGLLAGTVLLWSNDFALPTAILLSACVLLDVWQRHRPPPATLFAQPAVAALTAAALMTAATGGHAMALLQYNFLDVARDQWWYFAFYSDQSRIFGSADIGKLLYDESYPPLAALLALALAAFFSRQREVFFLLALSATLVLGGLLASVGGHIGGYFGNARFFSGMLVAVAALRGVALLTAQPPRLQSTLPLLGAALAAGACGWSAMKAHADHRNAAADTERFYVPELGGYLPLEWQAYIQLARSTPGMVIEEYWGLWSATRRAFPAWPVDSVIHALGRVRLSAAAQLPQASTVITTRHRTSSTWQPWSISQNFWFYEALFRNWSPKALSPTTVVWHRLRAPTPDKPVPCTAESGQSASIQIVAPRPGYYQLSLDYELTGRGRALLMLQNNLSFGGDAEGFVSVDPVGTHVRFPVFVPREGPVRLGISVRSRPGRAVRLGHCTASALPPLGRDVLHTMAAGEQDSWTGCDLESVLGRPNARCEIVNRTPHRAGFLSFGPYARLPAGRYRFWIEYTAASPSGMEVGNWEVAVAPINGRQGGTIAKAAIVGTHGKAGRVESEFTLAGSPDDPPLPIEVRVLSLPNLISSVQRLTIVRVD